MTTPTPPFRAGHVGSLLRPDSVKAARKAYGPWSRLKASERGKYVYRIARILQERSREFAAIESLDGGKPIRESGRRHPARCRAFLLLRGVGRQT